MNHRFFRHSLFQFLFQYSLKNPYRTSIPENNTRVSLKYTQKLILYSDENIEKRSKRLKEGTEKTGKERNKSLIDWIRKRIKLKK
jgi:hypothetical protein